MSSIPRGVLRDMAGGNQRPKDRWEPDATPESASAVRLYRWEVPVTVPSENGPVTSIEKRVVETREIHFNGPGKAPDDCPGQNVCERCRKAALLEAQNTDEARDQAFKFKATTDTTFVVVPIDEPTRFRTYGARFSAFQGIVLEAAKAGGWRSAKYPPKDAWKEGAETGPLFDKCVDAGWDRICGPKGRDIILTPVKKGKGVSWLVSCIQDANTVLPFPEDDKVINPAVIQARIKAAMAKKAGMSKEGDE